MKQLIAVAAVAMLAASAFAQDGTVSFGNGAATRFYLYDYNFYPVTSNVVTSAPMNTQGTPDMMIYGGPGVLDVGLFWSTSAFSTIAGGTLAGIENIGSTYPGELAGNAAFSIPGTAPGETVFMQCFAWDGSYGDSAAGLQACLNAGGWFGATTAGSANSVYGAIGSPIEVTLGLPYPAPGIIIFGTVTGLFGKTALLAANPYVPEPGTIALGSLGAAALLFFRWRK